MNTKTIFKKFLKNNNAYTHFHKEIEFKYQSIDNYLHQQRNDYPGLFLKDAFVWPDSITQSKKEAYPYWSSLNYKWWDYIKENNIQDKTEIVKRSF